MTVPEHAYMFGFIQADGHLYESTRNRGRVEIELQERDRDILEKFKEIIPFNSSFLIRTRDTNFKKNYTSVTLTVYDINFRKQLIDAGLTYGKKSEIIVVPKGDISVADYWRGVIDGDGSLGFSKTNIPLISLNTSSDQLAQSYNEFLEILLGKKKILNRNRRDNTYNICVYSEDTQSVIRKIYYDNCIALNRKFNLSQEILNWKRPTSKIKITWNVKSWTKEEDDFICTHSLNESIVKLHRTEKSIKIRLWRLNKCSKIKL